MNNRILLSYHTILVDGYLWMVPIRLDSLVKIDIQNRRLEAIYPLPKSQGEISGHDQLLYFHNHIYIIPYNGTDIYVFDIECEKYEKIALGLNEDEERVPDKYECAAICERRLIIFGRRLENIYIIDIDNRKITTLSYPTALLEEEGLSFEECCFGSRYCVKDDHIFLPTWMNNYVLQIDLQTMYSKLYKVGAETRYQITSITAYEDAFYLTTANDEVICWNIDRGIERVSKNDDSMFGIWGCVDVVAIGNALVYIPTCVPHIIIEENGDRNILKIDEELHEPGKLVFRNVCVVDNNIYVQLEKTGEFVKVDVNDKTLSVFSIMIDDGIDVAFKDKKYYSQDIFEEYHPVEVKWFIDELINS